MDIGLPTTFGAKARTTALATKNSNGNGCWCDHAAFYHMDNGIPIYLLAKIIIFIIVELSRRAMMRM